MDNEDRDDVPIITQTRQNEILKLLDEIKVSTLIRADESGAFNGSLSVHKDNGEEKEEDGTDYTIKHKVISVVNKANNTSSKHGKESGSKTKSNETIDFKHIDASESSKSNESKTTIKEKSFMGNEDKTNESEKLSSEDGTHLLKRSEWILSSN